MRSNRPAYGSFVFSPDPAVTEIIGAAGFDLAIIDTEHAGLTIDHVYNHGRAARARALSWWVRIGRVDPAEICRFLDAGAQGILFPHFGLESSTPINYSSLLRYPPAGSRPTCTGTSSADFGVTPFSVYAERANTETISIGLVEDRAAVERIEDILMHSDIDAVMPGGIGDLASSYGVHGQANHPKVMSAVERVIMAAKTAGKKVGVYLSDVFTHENYARFAPDFYIYSIDHKILAASYVDILKKISK
jgi:2-keto-3-deoxy-L-rhamnonate aldolase RhmA